MEKTVSAVLVAAGSSTRMGFDKLSFDLGGETVLHRSIRAFAQCPLVDEIILVAGSNRVFAQQQIPKNVFHRVEQLKGVITILDILRKKLFHLIKAISLQSPIY